MAVTIKTNNVPRFTVDGFELTKKERAEFNYYTDEEINGKIFIRYKKEVICLDDFMRCPPGVEELKGWDGYRADSYFSAVVLKFADRMNFDTVIMGTLFS